MSMFGMADRNAGSRLAAGGMGLEGDPAMGEGKVPMTEVAYREAENPSVACGTCAHFQPPEGCGLVAGRIVPNGVCDLYEPAQMAAPEARPAEAGPPPPM